MCGGSWSPSRSEGSNGFVESVAIYPIIGYDMGIVLDNAVCLNVNWLPYWREPEEILYYTIHEITHVFYERHHVIPPLEECSFGRAVGLIPGAVAPERGSGRVCTLGAATVGGPSR
jgi:hypothetical protein